MPRQHNYYVYVMASISEVLYIGVTNDLSRRVSEHKSGLARGFSLRYRTKKLVYYEQFDTVTYAIKREKQLKNWHREWKLNLIKKENPLMTDLSLGW